MQPISTRFFLAAALTLAAFRAEAQVAGIERGLATIRTATEHGLAPEHYGLQQLEHLAATDPGRLDSSLAAQLTRLAEDLYFGRVRPNAYSALRTNEQRDIHSAVRAALAADSVPELMDDLAPPFSQYARLRHALSQIRTKGAKDPIGTGHARQIALAMERIRWLPRLTAQRVVLVNIPAFELAAFDSANFEGLSLTMRVIVGRATSTRTPLLAAGLRAVEFRPYWNVPRSILERELLPAMRRNPRYLIEHDMEVLAGDSLLGSTQTPEILDRLARGDARVRQRPTAKNALGAVKFEFPNASSIFLHDTPEKSLFSRSKRDLSHGCIRLEAPAALAEWALIGHSRWTSDSTRVALKATNRRVLNVATPTTVILFYATAEVGTDGAVRFYDDIYGLDRQLAVALDLNR